MGSDKPHDALFRAVFSDPGDAAGLLAAVLPATSLERLDLSRLRCDPGTFVDPRYADAETDLLFELPARGGDGVLVYFLFEHRSTGAPLLPFRLLRYQCRIWQELIEREPGRRTLPPIVPVLVAHAPRGWRHPIRMRDLFALDDGLRNAFGAHLVEQELVVDDIARVPDELLEARRMRALARAALLLLEHGRSDGLLERLFERVGLLRRVYSEGGAEALHLLARHRLQVDNERVTAEQVRDVLALAAGEQGWSAMASIADRLHQEGREEGLEEGLRRGRAETLLLQLRQRFGDLPAGVPERVVNAALPDLDRWVGRILVADTLAAVLDGDDPAPHAPARARRRRP